MLVDDDNKVKLLKMKEKLLEVSAQNRVENLQDYKKLAIEIDRDIFESFVNKIKNTNYHKLPYDEQLAYLIELEQEYNELNELQYGFKNIYQKYSDDELVLSNINDILIDEIRARISNIEGYLINSKRLEVNKNDLEKLNMQLITFEKKRNAAKERFLSMEKDLRYDFINAEGRKIENGESKYASIIDEYNANSYDLRKLIDNQDELESNLIRANEEKDATEEKLIAARICYQNMPTDENLEVYNSIDKDMLLARYKLTLLQMINLIAQDKDNYNEMITKRMQFKALNNLRIDCLNKLNVKFMIDPFSRTKIDSQIESIKGYEGLGEEILVLRRRIANLSTVVENRVNSNTDFIIFLNSEVDFVKDNTSFLEVKEESEVDDEQEKLPLDSKEEKIDREVSEDEKNIEIVKQIKKIAKNQVLSIMLPSKNFAFERVKEKTDSVITRIAHLFLGDKKNDRIIKSPDLLIQESMPDVNYYQNNNNAEELFIDNLSNEKENLIQEIFEDDLDGNPFDDNSVDNSLFTDNQNDIPINTTENDLFKEIEPFQKTPLFSERYDDSIFNNEFTSKEKIFDDNKIDNNPEEAKNELKQDVPSNVDMPDIFWVTQDSTTIEKNDKPTFDEQIDKLMNEENDDNTSRRKR